jgi:hypothetical protein
MRTTPQRLSLYTTSRVVVASETVVVEDEDEEVEVPNLRHQK